MRIKYRARLALLRVSGRLLRRSGLTSPAPLGSPRVVLIRPDHLGDVLLSRPAAAALQTAVPAARLTWLVGPWGWPALGQLPDGEVRICPFPAFSRERLRPVQAYLLLARHARRLRVGRYDMALILRRDHWWGALLAALAGVPVRVGYATEETAPFLTHALPLDGGRHAVEEGLALAQAAAEIARGQLASRSPATAPVTIPRILDGAGSGVPPLPTVATDADRQAVSAMLEQSGVGAASRLLVLHPGSGSGLKAWPLERFASVGWALAERLCAIVVVTGSLAEEAMVRDLCALLPPGSLNVAGRLDWGELEALLARATLVIGVDSGPLHLATAAGTPSVALFGPADPAQFAPWGPPARHRIVHADLPCRPCRRLDICRIEPDAVGPPPCMRALDVRQVLEVAERTLRPTP